MNTSLQSTTLAIARTLMVVVFLLSGLSKISSTDAIAGYMEVMGVPSLLLWPTIAFEIGSAALIVLGFHTRITAILLAGFSLVTAIVFHHQFSDQTQLIMFLKNIAMTGGFLLLACTGPGLLSIDARRSAA
ncbi:MAG: DoxX family protein [Burkholderiales bacterium]